VVHDFLASLGETGCVPKLLRRGIPLARTVLRLGEADVLGKTVSLPLAAERELDQALAFEMDRETPFTAEELYWNHRIIEADRQNGRLSVRLSLVPKANLDPLLTDLAAVGIQPTRVEIADGPDKGVGRRV